MIKPAREIGFSPDIFSITAKMPTLPRRPDQLRFFVDGQCCHDLTRSEAHAESSSKLTIGGMANGTQLFTGYLSNIRLIKGSCLYKKNFTVPTAHSDG